MSEALLEVRGLVSGYGAVVAVHGVDLTIPAGAVTAVVGSNGAGKSTTLRAISGLLPIRAGTIRFDGDDVTALSTDQRVDRGIVMVPEGRLIFPRMSVEENLRIGAFAPRGRSHRAETLATVYSMFPRLKERRGQMGGTLSGGEQQMLALGRGLMARPKVLLLDEPTLGLAPMMAHQIFEAIETLIAEGVTILLSEQNVGMSLEVSETAFVLENGLVVLSGSGAELLDSDEIKRAYLGM